ncbi:hypothetical protein C8F04DRAFT_1396374 [Mycena alexandri]|uniref:F-box domain-containing protein n=1 Tax=Mycena alexandri TaxID=1745969 RepID=A0AAD6X146_9AGAR|nr:hypothetical protein C8F04DRAFT_1396374 [Mycena alexandri]
MISFNTLPADIMLQIVPYVNLRDLVVLSMVTKSLCKLSKEHAFWYATLCHTRLTQPIPGPSTTNLADMSALSLKNMALHFLRLDRNWSQPYPRITGTPKALHIGSHTTILFCLPGTSTVVLYSLEYRTVRCVDAQLGNMSEPLAVGHVTDVGASLEQEEGGVSVPLLVRNIDDVGGARAIVVLHATATPEPSVSLAWRRDLDNEGHTFAGVFMNASIVGISRGHIGGSIELQAFNLKDPELETVIVTDRPHDDSFSTLVDTLVISDTVYLVILDASIAFVYACPPRLLPYAHSTLDDPGAIDYTLQRSHVARIPQSGSPEWITRLNGGFLRTSPTWSGAHGVSVVYAFADAVPLNHRVEVTFWARPNSSSADSDVERERATARTLRPTHTLAVPGTVHMPMRDFRGQIVAAAGSGRTAVVCVDPCPPPPATEVEGEGEEAEASDTEEDDREAPREGRVPNIMLVRYDADAANGAGVGTVHELRIPKGTCGLRVGEAEEAEAESQLVEFNAWKICAVELDDHAGRLFVGVGVEAEEGVLFCFEYA